MSYSFSLKPNTVVINTEDALISRSVNCPGVTVYLSVTKTVSQAVSHFFVRSSYESLESGIEFTHVVKRTESKVNKSGSEIYKDVKVYILPDDN